MNNTEKIYLTQQSLEEYKKELEYLQNVVRPQVIEEIRDARSQGDLSENAEYDAAREKQGQIEARITEIQHILDNYEIIDESSVKSVVQIGSTVTFQMKNDKSIEKTLQIVGSLEANPFEQKISNNSPLAKALLGHKVGDDVEVDVDKKYEIIIKEIK
ncbi:transcription elongation factor GreA [Mycoplasma zalophi]|uniref:Transcription elongation factor GreA n=1 Tax=Mycoplasma zalophi TaxID=191287 RepID=A0ABS6DQD2_9MOLU|nr:transcription elongation factor GreA [Mycoplasma zalophi]MBU4690770.1 transcription elongation factor GreA [Mycoplasma zalophi]MBU4692414.1 transcription elongation factor GreA [Mycoplasma zalophi]